MLPRTLEKSRLAALFSDLPFDSGGKKRGFCRLLRERASRRALR
jgi:hypothetical protein